MWLSEVRVGECCCFITCRDFSSVLFTLAGTWGRLNTAPNKTLKTSSTNICIKSTIKNRYQKLLRSFSRVNWEINYIRSIGWGWSAFLRSGVPPFNYRHPSLLRERTTVWHAMITTILCLAVDRTKTENNETVGPPHFEYWNTRSFSQSCWEAQPSQFAFLDNSKLAHSKITKRTF